MQAAFEACDSDISQAALPDNKGRIDKFGNVFMLILFHYRSSAMIAASGSCATLAHVRHGHLHVANTGDGAAVLGLVTFFSFLVTLRAMEVCFLLQELQVQMVE